MQLWKVLSVLLLFSLFGLSSAENPCGHIATKHNFTVSQFLGRWFEIMRFPNYPIENDSYVCVQYFYSRKENVSIFMDARLNATDGDHVNSTLEAQLNSTDYSKWRLFDPDVPYWIIDTDYKTYAATWTCVPTNEYGDTLQYSWILSRKPFIQTNILDKLLTKLSKMGIPITDYETTTQEGCWKNY